jgi:serine/threonine protein kinase
MGIRLGRYAVLKHLASGGMADVLLARSDGIEGFERHVVLKRIRPEHARDQRFIRMFLDEARVAATLHHQHIVQVHDIGEAAGEYFIAMEYLHGEDVRTVLSAASKTRVHTPLGIAISVVSAAAAGLHYAHERTGSDMRPLGIVHRDVSPSNILVGYDGSIKVVDFGIAKAAMREETRSGSLKGKLSYMSPEQCKGDSVDRRSDVYALGVVLYELATTTRLFKNDNDYVVMEQIVNGRITLPRVRRPDLPRELSDIIMQALAPDRDRRYASADELRVALDHFAARSGMVTSTSEIAAYMRKQFGERPEPWIGLTEEQSTALDNIPTMIGALEPAASWTELPASSSHHSMRRSAAIPLPSDPTALIAKDRRLEAAAQRATPITRPSMQLPTDVKLGWESQPLPPARGVPSWSKIAMIGAPLLLLATIGTWRLAGSSPSSAPTQIAAAAVMAPPPAAVPAAPVIARDPAGAMPVITLQEAEPAARKPRPAPAPSVPRSIETAPARHTRSPSTTTTAPRGLAASVSIGDLQRLTPTPPEAPAAVPPIRPAPAPAPTPTPAPVPAQVVITPGVLEANRISGDKRIVPDNSTKTAIDRAGVDKVAGAVKFCVGADGSITSVSLLTSTGFPSYDDTILRTIRREWRYRPFVANGKPNAVCTAVRFVYSQK